MIPALIWGFPSGADLQNHLRFVLPFYDEISAGNYVPAWLAESNFGYGDPRFRFYPPLLYYFWVGIQLLVKDWYSSSILAFTITSVLGSIGIYLWVKETLSKETAFISVIIFNIAPYHISQFYQASLLAEFFAISLLPFCFLFVEKLMKPKGEGQFRNNVFAIIGLGIFYSLLIMTHIPTTVIASLSLGFYALLLTDFKNYKKGLVFCSIGIFLGLLLSSWFWLKMLSELSWIQAGTGVSSAHYDYTNNFIFSPFALVSLNTWYANLNAVLTLCLILPSVYLFRQLFKREPDVSISRFFTIEKTVAAKRLFAVLILMVATFLMTTDLSRPLWIIIPKLKDIQFPFRWLTIVSIMVCPLAALGIQYWRKSLDRSNLRPLHLVIVLAFFSSIGYTFYDLVLNSEFVGKQTFTERLEPIRGARSFKDWLPTGAAELKDMSPMDGQAVAGNRRVETVSITAEKRRFFIKGGEETELEIRAYNYPLWRAYLFDNGELIELPISANQDGAIKIAIPQNDVEIELIFVRTITEYVGLCASILGWLVVLGLIGLLMLHTGRS